MHMNMGFYEWVVFMAFWPQVKCYNTWYDVTLPNMADHSIIEKLESGSLLAYCLTNLLLA